MEVTKMTYTYENKELGLSVDTIVDSKQVVYFKAKDVAESLGYSNTRDAILKHVPEKYKYNLNDLIRVAFRDSSKNQHPDTIYISEPGLYALIFSSRLETSVLFQNWVFSSVLPSIRKYGYYRHFNNSKNDCFKIENEEDLHVKVVSYIKRFYPQCLLIAGLGENQTTKNLRIKSKMKGYQKGQPDLIIQNLHKYYSGFCIEFKTPLKNGILSVDQNELLTNYENNGYKTLVCSDYDIIIKQINEYMQFVRVKCKYCNRMFKSKHTLNNHLIYFHRVNKLLDKTA